jgi:hypothetical protein
MGGRSSIAVAGKDIVLVQKTDYPWSGKIRITLELRRPVELEICLRIPGWCEGETIKVNGEEIKTAVRETGYARIAKRWNHGDAIELDLPMPVRRVYADPNVKDDVGRVAIMRGPIVYCVEGVDNGGHVRNLSLSRTAVLSVEYRPGLLNGVTVVKGRALSVSSRAEGPGAFDTKGVDLVAVPYYAWDNRAPGEMVVWLPEDPVLAEPVPSSGP